MEAQDWEIQPNVLVSWRPEATLKVEFESSANDVVSRLAFAFGDLVTLFQSACTVLKKPVHVKVHAIQSVRFRFESRT